MSAACSAASRRAHGPFSTRAFYPVINFTVSFSHFPRYPSLSDAVSSHIALARVLLPVFTTLRGRHRFSSRYILYSIGSRIYNRAHVTGGVIKYISLPRNTHSINPRTTQLLLNKLKTHPPHIFIYIYIYTRS